jgi:hypothetical protein
MSSNINKVFGIGLSGTGTSSLNNALHLLGIKTVHDPTDLETITRLANGLIADLPLLEKYDGITDIQTVPFYPQFDEEYPGSKFILTSRNVEQWLPSVAAKIIGGGEVRLRQLKEDNLTKRHYIRAAVYGVIQYNESVFRHKLRIHHAAVLDYFKDRDNLLVMDITAGQGWDVLCPFLGKEIPNVSFPFKNARNKE